MSANNPSTLVVCEEAVIASIRARREHGLKKYGTSVERTDIDLIGWLQHLQEELMDASIYAERLKREAVGTYDAGKDECIAELQRRIQALLNAGETIRRVALRTVSFTQIHDQAMAAVRNWDSAAVASIKPIATRTSVEVPPPNRTTDDSIVS